MESLMGGVFLYSSRPQAGKFWDFEVQHHDIVEIVFLAIEIDVLACRNVKISACGGAKFGQNLPLLHYLALHSQVGQQ